MNKFYTLIFTLFTIAGLTGCKNDAQNPVKTIANNNSSLILGNWARSKTIDTVNTEGTVHIDSANVNNDYGYVFKSDGTGIVTQLGLKVFEIKYAMLTGKIGINVTQGYNQDGTPSAVHIIPYSVNFVRLTTTELVLRRDTTMILSGTAVSHVITVDHYTKR